MFLTKDQVSLINGSPVKGGGYLSNGTVPVHNAEFVAAQNEAHGLVTLANNLSKANFEACETDTFAGVLAATSDELNSVNQVKYVEKLSKPFTPTLDAVVEESMKWLNAQGEAGTDDRVNAYMQRFNILFQFEEMGLYFTEGESVLTKLHNIYVVDEIVGAVQVIFKHGELA